MEKARVSILLNIKIPKEVYERIEPMLVSPEEFIAIISQGTVRRKKQRNQCQKVLLCTLLEFVLSKLSGYQTLALSFRAAEILGSRGYYTDLTSEIKLHIK